MSDCKHDNTEIWEPHLAGARRCQDCFAIKYSASGKWVLNNQKKTEPDELRNEYIKIHTVEYLALRFPNDKIMTHIAKRFQVLEEREKKLLAIFDAVRNLDQFSSKEAIESICIRLQKARLDYEALESREK